jgi:hypothetical protein
MAWSGTSGPAGTTWPEPRAYAPLLTRTLQHLNVTSARVATVVASDVRYLSDMLNTIQQTPDKYGISFNGKSVTDATADEYLSLAEAAPYTDQTTALLAFKPHVIIADTGTEFLTKIIPVLEANWDAAAPGQAHPFYLLSPFQYNSQELQSLVAANPQIKTRLAGVNGPAAEDQTLYKTYTRAWDTAYPMKAGVRGYENFYDAAYYLTYAAAAAARGGTQSTGVDLARGMQLLLTGPGRPLHSVGTEDMPSAMRDLTTGPITLNGTLGPPDFDPSSGTRQAAGSVWCVDSANVTQSDVLRYSNPSGTAVDATLVGTFPCIAGF